MKIIIFFVKYIDYEVLPCIIGDKVKISQLFILWYLQGEMKVKRFVEILDLL